MSDQIDVYRKDTGEKVRIPARWINHPRLGEPFAKTPRQRAAERKSKPSTADKGETTDA